MRSRGILGLIFGVMLAAVMGSSVQAQDNLCTTANPDGIINAASISTQIAPGETGVVAGLLGTQEVFNGSVIGGLDWLYNNQLLSSPNFPTTEVGTQLISWWTLDSDRETFLQVTNTNPALDTEVHVVITGTDCQEIVNFCDSFTPNDTHVYEIGNLVRNEDGSAVAASPQPADVEGTVVVTPTVGCDEASLTFPAIEFNYLQGTSTVFDEDVDLGVNVYSRFANGDGCDANAFDQVVNDDSDDMTPDGTIDGTDFDATLAGGILEGTMVNTNDAADSDDDTIENQDCSFASILPTSLTKDYSTLGDGPTAADLVFLQILDNYNAFGSNSYFPEPLVSSITASIVDDAENGLSCGTRTGCFIRTGIDTVVTNSDDVDLDPGPGEELCDGADGDDDGLIDCADPDCDLEDICENGDVECSDGMDNDGDGLIDCADAGCDGAAGGPAGELCEAGTEVSCDDGFDNDGDTLVDGDDPDCVVPDPGDGDGGGSGCSVAATSSTGTSAAGILLPMMVFGLGIMVRRRMRKK